MILIIGLVLVHPFLVQAILNAAGKVDFFINIEDIQGESNDSSHKDWIDVEDFLWGQSMPEEKSKSAGSKGVSAAIPGHLTITKRVDRASSKLAEFKSKGRVIRSMIVDAPSKSGKQGRLITTLNTVKIVALTASPGGKTEKVKFAYQSYRIVFTPSNK